MQGRQPSREHPPRGTVASPQGHLPILQTPSAPAVVPPEEQSTEVDPTPWRNISRKGLNCLVLLGAGHRHRRPRGGRISGSAGLGGLSHFWQQDIALKFPFCFENTKMETFSC